MKLLDWLTEKLKNANVLKISLSRKTVTNLIVLLCLGMVFLIVADFYGDLYGTKRNNQQLTTDPSVEVASEAGVKSTNNYIRDMELQLSGILSKIDNAGKVSVMITLKSSSEVVPAKDEVVSDKVTNEKDNDGGTRIINETSTNDRVVFQNESGGNSKPLIVKEIHPEVKGVIVVAEGAKDAKVKLKLSQAVQTVLDVPAYRVTVYERH